jgi:hypothetical protein
LFYNDIDLDNLFFLNQQVTLILLAWTLRTHLNASCIYLTLPRHLPA